MDIEDIKAELMQGESGPDEEDDKAHFPNLEQAPNRKPTMRELDFLLDIPLEVSVELGSTNMLVNDLLQLGQGSVIELNKLAGEPLEILVNHTLIARGEAVVINEKFGVRITDIISPTERVKQLG
ncbi:MAG: flagellar motor switch protein FliN [Syntrophobacteraceae bacterium]|jgi:flagellar motor switch protein FliN/FliY|nr:flagellar motor switch protein FliN [Syntrophobacteraceae bacterium]